MEEDGLTLLALQYHLSGCNDLRRLQGRWKDQEHHQNLEEQGFLYPNPVCS